VPKRAVVQIRRWTKEGVRAPKEKEEKISSSKHKGNGERVKNTGPSTLGMVRNYDVNTVKLEGGAEETRGGEGVGGEQDLNKEYQKGGVSIYLR